MKGLKNLQCPHCHKNSGYVCKITETCLWDDSFYETMSIEFGKPFSGDTASYMCKCDDCGKYFNAKLKLKVEIESVKTSIDEFDD